MNDSGNYSFWRVVVTTLLVSLALALALGASGCTSGPNPPTVSEFVDEWAPRLLDIGPTADLGGESAGYVDDEVFIRHFADGSWVAARTIDYEFAHLPDAEAVNSTVFADSTGAVYYLADFHLCYGELGSLLATSSVPASSVVDVWPALDGRFVRGWDLQTWSGVDEPAD